MVAVLFVAGPALAAFACSLELVTYSRTSTKGIAAARALSQTVCVGTLLCVGISGSFVGALGARVPGDGPAKPDIDQPLDDSQNREEWQVEFVATGGPGVSLEGDSSSMGESRGPDSRPQIPAATSGAESGSGPAGGTRSGLGLARKITVPGRGDLPYGQLAMEGFRRRAQQLREQWEDEDRYMKQTVGRAIVSQSGLPTQQQVQHWKASASYRYQRRYRIRMREAATLESMAEEISVKLKAAGVDIPSSDGHPSPPSRTRDQASSTGSDAIPPGTASGSGGSGITIRSYVQIGVSMLRKEAREIDSLWANKDEFVGEHVAARIARSINQYPTDSLVDQWILDAKRMHTQRKVLHEEKSASLRALAEEWEKRLISGALIQEDSGETGRHHKRQRKPSSGGLATISVSSAPSVSSASQAAQSEGSLRGTVLGSCVELPGMGSVPYVKLAIQKLRREAHNLIFRWQSIETYIRLRIVENMLEKKNRNPSPAQVWHWIALARQSYSRFGPLRTQEAADLNSVADDLETRASAAGLLVRSPQEAPVHGSELVRGQPAPASEGVSCGAEVTFAHLAIEHLRRQAEELDATWGSAEEHFVATRIAYRIARANAPPPHPGKQQEWAFQDRTTFRAARAVHQRKAQHIRDQADALEQELRDLLSSTPSRAAEPARESASTGELPMPC
ncbi:KRUF family protein [Toxoplasma gondii COUG]|uniref:KRUF family protein n=1 Tax=Toxoplasma gondii COUG TaxID=1074873 RepID=A0A2G8XM07_TOXGO|nr:KRUF family protein [Toxoplasma gondii COUG]